MGGVVILETYQSYNKLLRQISGKTIAIVYIFEKEDAPGFQHYDIWESDVISEWLNALQELHCIPFILDSRTFINKAMNYSLPVIDYVINLNAGNSQLSTLGLIPSICSFLSIPCIPCNTISIITGENKLISNLIAETKQLNVPKELSATNDTGIFRPLNYGSSRGVLRGKSTSENVNGIYQTFIPGYDITTPILYNPMSHRLEVLPSVMYYLPDSKDPEWFLGEEAKSARQGYKKKLLYIDSKAADRYIELAKTISVNTYCRIDSRIHCESPDEWECLFTAQVPFNKIFFLEINPMPTLKQRINFHDAILGLKPDDSFYQSFTAYKECISNASPTGFILSCAIIANIKARH